MLKYVVLDYAEFYSELTVVRRCPVSEKMLEYVVQDYAEFYSELTVVRRCPVSEKMYEYVVQDYAEPFRIFFFKTVIETKCKIALVCFFGQGDGKKWVPIQLSKTGPYK